MLYSTVATKTARYMRFSMTPPSNTLVQALFLATLKLPG